MLIDLPERAQHVEIVVPCESSPRMTHAIDISQPLSLATHLPSNRDYHSPRLIGLLNRIILRSQSDTAIPRRG